MYPFTNVDLEFIQFFKIGFGEAPDICAKSHNGYNNDPIELNVGTVPVYLLSGINKGVYERQVAFSQSSQIYSLLAYYPRDKGNSNPIRITYI